MNKNPVDFLDRMRELTQFHQEHCKDYSKMLEGLGICIEDIENLEDVPFLPARLFKTLDLKSIPEDEVYKTLLSSGTSGQQPSKIYLSKENALNQQLALVKIVQHYIGKERRPMLVMDAADVLRDRQKFSARGAGILGFSIFSKKMYYALDNDMEINVSEIEKFLKAVEGKSFLIFGFTYIIWEKLVLALEKRNIKLALDKGILIHGGGWKKLSEVAVDSAEFARRVYKNTGIKQVINYYGMVEQTGSIYLTCPEGRYHMNEFGHILIRKPENLDLAEDGEIGLIQVMSTLPISYPGHSILTEDLGVIDTTPCPCGREEKTFEILGRVKGAEIRGCSDTYEN